MFFRNRRATIITYTQNENLTPQDIKTLVEQSLDADKGVDIVTVDLSEGSAIADYMVIVSGTSSRHTMAMASKLRERLNARGIRGIRTEGEMQGDWILVDAGDVIVHIFKPEVRDFYNLEKMWCTHPTFEIVTNQVPA